MRFTQTAILFSLAVAVQAQTSTISFTKQVRPLLEGHCAMCHSADTHTSDFEVSTYGALLAGGHKRGPAVIVGKPNQSPIVRYLTGDLEPRMPKGMTALKPAEIDVVRSWIEQGAPDDTPQASEIADKDKLLNAALFSENAEQLLVLRRAMRLAYVSKPASPPQADPDYTNPIDQFILAKWVQANLPEAKQRPHLCGDTEFLRRAYLDVIGVIPTIDEAKAFLADTAPNKREKLIDSLLARNADYAANWTPFWEEAIASTDTGVVGGIVRHGDYQKWIYQNFVTNKPYDVMVAELIDPTMPGFRKTKPEKQNGDVYLYPSYVLNADHDQTIQTAANTAQVFLGTSMKCASCHNHFLNREWPQARFLEFASLFASSNLEVVRCEAHTGKYVQAKFPFDLPGVPKDVPLDINSRLHRLAQILTDPTDERFSKTIVNRLWKRYVGLGLFEPADDFRADRQPSHPELLAWLAYDFMQNGYDLKHTIRLILTSRTYQLQYDPKLEDHFDVAKPAEPRYFRSPTLRRLTAEELLDSIQIASTQQLDSSERLYRQRKSTDLTRALGRPAAHNEVSTGRPDDVAIVQALELLNGEEFHERVYGAQILQNSPGVDRLYWAVFNRAPTENERQLAEKFVGSKPSQEALGDMLWALLSSPAFQYIN